MLAELECGQDAYPLMLDCLLDHVMAGLVRKHASKALRWPSRPLALAPYRLRRVLDFIDASLGDDIALTDLAAAAGSSQAHFSRAFQIAVGSSPYHYVLQRRIDYARVLLLTSDDSLQHVGTRSGFRSQQQFGLMFKRLVGVGPKRFRMNSTWPRR